MKMNLKYYSYLQATASKVSGENEQNPKGADEEQKEKKYADSFSAA